ncbi:hypothetical protein ACFC01_17940 [Streptomyces mirabilis]|uniref:hypothetical protein n=1 Tax=Streptomyces mirabilis TaxID=68239 RepID=UPI0035DA87DF
MTSNNTTDPLTGQQLDEIETRAASLHEYATLTDQPLQADADQLTGEDVPALLAEVRRLTARVAELEPDVDLLEALRAYGVDNWDGYDEAIQAAESS